MTKAKKLRKRYLVFRLVYANTPIEQVASLIEESFTTLFGIEGLAKAYFKVILKDEKRRGGIIVCSHKSVPKVRAAVALANVNNDGVLYIVKVTGTMKKAKRILQSLPNFT